MLNCHHTVTIHYDRVYAPTSTLYSQKMVSWDHGLLRAANSLVAPTLVRQMWRHNYVIGRNE